MQVAGGFNVFPEDTILVGPDQSREPYFRPGQQLTWQEKRHCLPHGPPMNSSGNPEEPPDPYANRSTPYVAPRFRGTPAGEFPDWFKFLSGLVILCSLLAVSSQVIVNMTGFFLPTPLLFLLHPVWPAVSILLVPVLVIYSLFRRRQRTWKIDVRSSGWANFFLWWGVLYYVLLGVQLLIRALW